MENITNQKSMIVLLIFCISITKETKLFAYFGYVYILLLSHLLIPFLLFLWQQSLLLHCEFLFLFLNQGSMFDAKKRIGFFPWLLVICGVLQPLPYLDFLFFFLFSFQVAHYFMYLRTLKKFHFMQVFLFDTLNVTAYFYEVLALIYFLSF